MIEDTAVVKKIARDAERAEVVAQVRTMDAEIYRLRRAREKLILEFGTCGAFLRDAGVSWVACKLIDGHAGPHHESVGV
ncbi:hypothetical protein PP304_gp148 [Gordonia phage Phendrix]|uniref:Uncharacterized protein n=1 Tax=Gordonia phage Phendrix TaxID=2593335 RepID=A0A514U188_9CAUD|nr:hypothetical protein PP304_gp148 [Gordonia phage Phendrix]QDK02721.1 hypothetical protein SEA_PHENDRIX_205 [Gordonia phage Phendrix]